MKTHLAGALACSLLCTAIVQGQTVSEQLQRAIYVQSMLGDLDAAIRQYQEVIAKSPATSEVRTQAERLLAAAESYRRLKTPALGQVVSSLYRHQLTGITFELPWFWKIQSTLPSSGSGEQADFSIPYPHAPSKRPAQASVWMTEFSAALDEVAIERQLEGAVADTARQRTRDGYRNWRLRESDGRQSARNPYVEGENQTTAISALADYQESGRDMVEGLVWVVGPKSMALFSLRMAAEDFYDGVIVSLYNVARSATLP